MKIKELSTRYSEISQAHKQAEEALNTRIHQRERQLERLNTKLRKLEFPSWIDNLIKPIADGLEKVYPEYRAEILGPFGVYRETAIHLYKKGLTHDELWLDKNLYNDSIKSINFIPGDLSRGELSIRNDKEDTGEFSKGTIGELNGMNHPSIPIPEHADIEWLKQYVS